MKVLHDMEQSNGNVIRKSTCTFSKTHTASIFVPKKVFRDLELFSVDDRKKQYITKNFTITPKPQNVIFSVHFSPSLLISHIETKLEQCEME